MGFPLTNRGLVSIGFDWWFRMFWIGFDWFSIVVQNGFEKN